MKISDRLLVLLPIFIWGTAGIAIKPAFDVLPPLFYAAVAFTFAALILFIFVRPNMRHLKTIFPAAFFLGPVHNGLCLTGLQGLDVGVVCVGLQTQMVFAVILAAIIFKERISMQQALGILIAFTGIVIFSGAPQVFNHLVPFLIVVLSAFFWGVANIFMKNIAHVSAKDFITLHCFVAAIGFWVLSFSLESNHIEMFANLDSLDVWASIFYMGFVVTVVAYAIWQYMVSKYPISQVTPYVLLVPVFGLFFSWLIRGEIITLQQIVGSVIVIGGLALIVLKIQFRRLKTQS